VVLLAYQTQNKTVMKSEPKRSEQEL